MDILVEKLFSNQSDRLIPAYFIRSTAPANVEDLVNQVDRDLPTIKDVVESLYQSVLSGRSDPSLVIAIHGYNTGPVGTPKDSILEGWYQPLCHFASNDPAIRKSQNNATFIGYRWPSESLSQDNIRKDAFSATPFLLRILFWAGVGFTLLSLLLLFLLQKPWPIFLTILGVMGASIVLSLYLLRITVYFRDHYRATNFGVTDLVEVIRKLDQGLIDRKMQETMTDTFFYERIGQKVEGTQVYDLDTFTRLMTCVRRELSRRQDLVLEADDPKFRRFLTRLKMDCDVPSGISTEVLTEVIQRLVILQGLEYDRAEQFWRKNIIKLSFIGHSMGGHVTTQVIRILSDVFDPNSVGTVSGPAVEKLPSARVGRVFSLGRLILVSPDIPTLAIQSGRANFLRSALRRFEEAYLFSSEGDLALRLASTAANYFSFPARSRYHGYRLGNVSIRPWFDSQRRRQRRTERYGVVNLEQSPGRPSYIPSEHLLKYLTLSVLNRGANENLDPAVQKQNLQRSQVADETITPDEIDREAIADLFTYFDCTEYQDRADYNPTAQQQDAYIMILDGQKSPLGLFDYVRLFKAYATFSPKHFPRKGRDVHGGYFWGKFSQLLMYRLAFLGFRGFLDSLLVTPPEFLAVTTPLPPDLKERIAQAQEVNTSIGLPMGLSPQSAPSLDQRQMMQLQTKRQTALEYLSWLCEQKQIQALVAPERYQVDVVGRDREEVRENFLLKARRGL